MANSILGICPSGADVQLCVVAGQRVTEKLTLNAPEDIRALPALVGKLRRSRKLPRQCVLVLPRQYAICRNTEISGEIPDFSEYFPNQQPIVRTFHRLTAAAPKALLDSLRLGFSRAGLELLGILPADAVLETLLRRADISHTVAVYDDADQTVSLFSRGQLRSTRRLTGDPEISLRQTLNVIALTGEAVTTLYAPEGAVSLPGIPCAALPGSPAAAAGFDPHHCNLSPKPPAVALRLPVVLALGAAVLLLWAKFGLLDPLEQKAAAYEALSRNQALLSQAQSRLAALPEAEENYRRFGPGGMTEQELYLPGVTEILVLLEKTLPEDAALEALTMSGDRLTLKLRSPTPDALPALTSALEASPLISSAALHSITQSADTVQAYLQLTLSMEAAVYE